MTANIMVSPPYHPFTLPKKFGVVFNGEVWCGLVDKDPLVQANQVQIYVVNEDGSRTPVSQPIEINSGGFLVYNGNPAKFVTDSNHSLLVRDSLKGTVWYEPNMANIDPQSLSEIISSPSGSSLIGFLQSGTGAANRTAQDKMRERRTFFDFGAAGDRVADDTIAVNNALKSESPVTATTKQGYKISSTVTSPANNMIYGEGVRSAIVCDAVPPGSPGLIITPDPDNNTRNLIGMSGLYVLRGGGGHAVVIDVESSGKRIGRYMCEKSFFSTSGNGVYALAVSNHLNVADKFFLASFKNTTFEGGLLLDGVGDSIEMLGCNFTGSNEALVFKQTTEDSTEAGGPSSVLLFQGNNTFADKGIYIMDARSPKLRDNNLECGNGPGTLNALICIQGLTKRIAGAEVTGNTILHAPHAQTGVYLGATDGALIDNNIFGVAATGHSIVISADAKNTCVGINQFIPSGTGREILDNGVGTKGVLKRATLQNGWINAQSYMEPASFIKDRNGIVHISGSVSSGVTAAETVMFTLPYAFTPEKRHYFSSFAQNSNGDYVIAVIRVDPDGSVRLTKADVGSTQIINLSLSGISFYSPDAV